MARISILGSMVAIAIVAPLVSEALELSDMKCTKFSYEEQLLEKVIRLELFVDTMEKKMKSTLNTVLKQLAKFQGEIPLDGMLADAPTTTEFSEVDEKTIDIIQKKMLQNIDERFYAFKNETIPQLNKRSMRLLRLEEKLNTPNIAFNAINVMKSPAKKRDPVIFTELLLNDGAGYNPQSGYFIAPVAGVYQFNSQLCASKSEDLEYAIKVEERRVIAGEFRAPPDALDGKCTSFWAHAIVRRGQKVSVQGWNAKLFNNDNDWNSFSGALIYRIDS
ncbi:hypothetical protein ACF0H5_022923 [Mactra antiquata]